MNRTEKIQIRLTYEELKRLRVLSDKADTTISDYIRNKLKLYKYKPYK